MDAESEWSSELSSAGRDPWRPLRRFTSARIALGRTGGSQRSSDVLSFRLAHARARDAVRQPWHTDALERSFAVVGYDTVRLETEATDRATFLLRPDFGRTLTAAARVALRQTQSQWGRRDLAIVVSDGLSARAAERHALPVITALAAELRTAGWTLYPIFIAPFGRVKLQDEIGAALGARHSLMLLGERPGLGSPDSLGAYFTYQPHPERTDADRNCVSNIRPEGLPPTAAAGKLARLLQESARLGVSGVLLKDTDRPPLSAARASLTP